MNTWREILWCWACSSRPDIFYYHIAFMGKYHFDDFWCKQLIHSSDLRKKAFRIWKGTCIEYTLKVKVASQLLTWQWPLWLLLLSREESKFLILLLNPQPYWSGEALQEGLIIGLSGYWCEKTLKRNPLKLCLVL